MKADWITSVTSLVDYKRNDILVTLPAALVYITSIGSCSSSNSAPSLPAVEYNLRKAARRLVAIDENIYLSLYHITAITTAGDP